MKQSQKSGAAAKQHSTTKSMAHHNAKPPTIYQYKRQRVSNERESYKPYGVPRDKIIESSLFIKRFDDIRCFLKECLGMTTAEREVALRLLRLDSYYGTVYPKASQICELPGCSRRTFWRVIRRLEEEGLIVVINQFVRREKAQTSNLYILDKLATLILRFILEHGGRGVGKPAKWVEGFIFLPYREFIAKLEAQQDLRASPLSRSPLMETVA